MTIGQRIAQKRKERGLSQEALGEALGVSRQSVYKWESDNALPEIDKLITMSKLFGVTIGWLLGVEETESGGGASAPPPPEEGNPELTEAQLKMVEEIVDRYLAARQPRKKRRWPWVIAAGLVLVVAFTKLQGDLQQIRNEYGSLRFAVDSIDRNVGYQIGSITDQMEEILRSQNDLTVSHSAKLISADYAANTVTFDLRATPRTYTDGMTAVFVAGDGLAAVEVPAEAGAGQEFSARLTCALTDNITISVVFVTGDMRETQKLEEYLYLYTESLPEIPWPEGDMDRIKLNDAGELWWPGQKCIAFLPNNAGRAYYGSASVAGIQEAEVQSLRVGLFRNRKLLGWLEPCEQPEYYHGSWNVDFYSFPEVSVIPEEGDVFCLAAVVVDEYGREHVYQSEPYGLNESRGTLAQMKSFTDVGIALSPEGWEY